MANDVEDCFAGYARPLWVINIRLSLSLWRREDGLSLVE